MRTLKKALSLVLVLAMVFALAVPGFAANTTKKAADFKDYSKVTNKEAVDVLTAIGVINGNADGTFAPEGSFTRAEAATLITYLTLGKSVADALPNTTCKFADVPAWAAKYVQYCANEGIVVGYDAKTFGANDPLTAAQWALMLLKAVGAKGVEEINADNFALATTKLAVSTGLATPDDMGGTFNRDAAAKLAFKALFYSETSSEKEVYKVEVTTDADNSMATVKAATYASFSEAYLVAKEAANTGDVWTVKSVKTQVKTNSLADKVFQLTSTESTDTLGRKVNTYTSTLKSLKDLNLVETATADYVISGKITSAKLYSTVGYKVCAADYTWTNKTDGTNNSGTGAEDAAYKPVSTATTTNFGFTANGTTTYIYVDNDAKTVTTSTVNTYVGEVKKVTEAKDGVARFVTLTNGKTFTTDNFAVKDIVLYTVGSDAAVLSMDKAEVVSGKLTKIAATGSANTYTVNGTAYAVSAKAVAGTGYAAANINKEVSFYVDAQGNMIMNKSTAASETTWIYVMANSATKTGDYMTGATQTVDVYGVTNAGEIVTLTADHFGASVASASANDKAGKLYTYTKNTTNSNYTLNEVTGAAATADIAKNATTVEYGTSAKAILNSNTQFIFITKETNSNSVKNVQTITGNANIATIDVQTGTSPDVVNHAFVAAENGVAKYIFVNTAAATAVTDTTKVVYVDNGTMTTGTEIGEDGATKTTYTYTKAWTVDGKLANGIVSKSTLSASGLFYINDDNTVGSGITTTSGVITAINGNVVTIGSTSYNITDKTAEIFAGEDVELKVGQTVSFKANTTATSNLDVIVVTADQVTYTLTVTGTGVTTTAYEVIKGTGVVNTIKLNGATSITSVTTATASSATTLTASTDYTWNATTHTLTLKGDSLTGAVVITAA